jgi:hypothetical protein
MVRRRRSLLVSVVLAAFASSSAAEPPQETGLRGRVVVAPELLEAKEWPVDEQRAAALRTPANVRRPRGRPLQPIKEPRPELLVVIDGEDLRDDAPPVRRLVVADMQFMPGQLLVPRPGPLTIENKQETVVTIIDGQGAELKKIAAGATETINVAVGKVVLSMREIPYARATVNVMSHAQILPVEPDGTIPLVAVPGGEYALSFFLGAAELRTQRLIMPQDGLLFLDATVSPHTVVDVTVKDASLQVAVPVGGP